MADNISATILRGEQEIPANRNIDNENEDGNENDNDNEKSQPLKGPGVYFKSF